MAKKVTLYQRVWRWLLGIYYKTERSLLNDPSKLEQYKKAVSLLPIQKNKVLFDNFGGKGYGDNPKYIAEELLRRKERVHINWLTQDDSYSFPKEIKPINRYSLRAYYEAATAKAFVYNTRSKKLTTKRRGQIYLQTWHGSIGYKKIEKDAEEKLSREYVSSAQEDGRLSDGIIVDGKHNEELYKRAFWLDPHCELLKIGSPRLDLLFDENKKRIVANRVRETLNIGADSFFALYAPTFRAEGSYSGYITDLSKIKIALSKRFGKIEIAVRLHPNAEKLYQLFNKERLNCEIINATGYPDVQELVIAADCLITDYSSIAYDFALLRKPVFLCVKDIEDYVLERGVYESFYQQPFKLNRNEDELINDIISFSQNDYSDRIDSFYDVNISYNSGNASKKAVDWLFQKGLGKRRISISF